MKRRNCIVIPILLLLASCTSNTKQEVADTKKSFKDFLDSYYEERLQFFPLDATEQGDNRYNNLLPNDISEAYRSQLKDFYTKNSKELSSYDRTLLTPQEKVSFDIFKREM